MTPKEDGGCELAATAHLACAVVELLLTLGFSVLTFALVVSLVHGLGILSTTAVVLWIAALWTITWIGVEVSVLRWGDRLGLSPATGGSGDCDS